MKLSSTIFTLIAAFSLLAACSKTTAQPPTYQNSAPVTQEEVTSVTMHRSACYGTCPVYTVTIKADGTVEFNGDQHVLIPGKSKSFVAKSDYDYLVSSIDRLQFSTWKGQYIYKEDGCKSVWTDNPTVDITVTGKKGKKHVSYYYGCRGFILAPKIDLLSKIIDDVAGTSKWIGLEK
ncbi:DUF6438 domain-containing protein [Xanthomonas sp. 1678]|uniref:DUF6438 domain-containing protein n=1 Tax=Xanthomonas sp. 1678 TaxID=3158788 RepID=UPI0028655D9B|nr:starvation-inducible outer membrane lipoprotein [Xanthomonas translucens]